MSIDRREMVRTRLLDRAFKAGEGVDARGRALAWSLDCRELTLHAPTLGAIVELLWPRVMRYRPDLIVGPNMSGDPIVAALLLTADLNGVDLRGGLLRRDRKAYGLRKLMEGPGVVPGAIAVVVDDVLARGSSAARTVRAVRELGAEPVAVVTIVDLEQTDCQRVAGIQYETLFTASELGLTVFREPPPSVVSGWRVRGVNSSIPIAPALAPAIAEHATILSGDKCGVLAVDRRGVVRSVGPAGNRVVVAANGLLMLGNATSVSAVDSVSLRQKWSIDVGGCAMKAATSGDVFVARDDVPEVMRIDSSSGTVVASRRLASAVDAMHVMGYALVVVGRSGVTLLDRSLEPRWLRDEPARSAAGGANTLFVLTHDHALTRLNPVDGSAAWSRGVGPRTLSSLVVADDRIVFAVESVLVGLSDTGSVQWVHTGPRRIVAGPVACGSGAVALADSQGMVRLLRVTDGQHLASYSLPVSIALAGSPNILAGVGADGDAWGLDVSGQS